MLVYVVLVVFVVYCGYVLVEGLGRMLMVYGGFFVVL